MATAPKSRCSGTVISRCEVSRRGFAAQNQRRLHFGLGRNPHLEKVVIRWPSGKVQAIDKPVTGQLHKIREGE